MHQQYLTKTGAAKLAKYFRILAVVSAAALLGTGARPQSLGFVPVAAHRGHTVSVRELQIPSKAIGKVEKGLKRLEKHDPEASLRHFAEAIEAAPDFYEAYYLKGVAEALLGRNNEALDSFQTAVDLSDGTFPQAEFGYALVLTRQGKAREAERVVRHGLEAGANIADGHVVLALALLEQKRLEDAEKSAHEALLLRQPGSAKGHLILADVQSARGDFRGQARELDAYLESYPDDRNHQQLEAARDAARRLAAKMEKGQ